MTQFEHWQEWHKRCALARCDAVAAAALTAFAWTRFRHYVRRVPRAARLSEAALPTARDCWHLFETNLTANRHGSGKCYKEWLFARLAGSRDPALDVIQGGASLLMRDVVRTYLLREAPTRWTVSLDAPTGSDGRGVPLVELLPDPHSADAAAARELTECAALTASRALRRLPRRERLLLLARHLGLPLHWPEVIAVAGVGRNRGSVLWRRVFAGLAQQVMRELPAEGRGVQLRVALDAAALLSRQILAWGRGHASAATLFRLAACQGPLAPVVDGARIDRRPMEAQV